ncbi:PAQR family membrane homeostasis protein TrhA [Kocuria rosea]|jgi:hemolysin III|uniref:PAQR family membrane homeostasis protein TrhA n=1 Tax=Kocuria rosea TaxID=1275 RepID=UPI00203AF199|nr:hemolysin III family protein [Kocuria rosea]MCM3688277.1 hemolysin III family protein [Kocuria rosea]
MERRQGTVGRAVEHLEGAVEQRIEDFLERKPAWRGWIHASFTPVVVVLGLVAILVAPTTELRLAAAVYGVTGILLFGVSAIYHRAYWPRRLHMVLRRMDHSNIALLIAGTYTPLAVALLSPGQSRVLLTVIWACAAGLVLFRLLWTLAPRWLYTPLYVVMGCLAVGYLPQFWQASPAAAVLTAAGGAAYIAGAVVYGTKRPRLLPEVFSFHEVFHACTVVGFLLHYAAILQAVLSR